MVALPRQTLRQPCPTLMLGAALEKKGCDSEGGAWRCPQTTQSEKRQHPGYLRVRKKPPSHQRWGGGWRVGMEDKNRLARNRQAKVTYLNY